MNTTQLKAALGDVLGLVALVAAVAAAIKVANVGVSISPSVETLTYLAVACAAAKMAR
jgi:hypothetical protein